MERMAENMQPETGPDGEKRRKLFLDQKALLNEFLAHGAITKAQYDKSFGDLMKKMGFDENGNKSDTY